METWRLIKDSPQTGAWNMATDEAIMEAVGTFESPPTLRFYAWEPVCLSLGYAQPIADIDRKQLVMHKWHIVRRATGGRAILHTDELTYSVALPRQHTLVHDDIVSSYRRLSAALMAGIEQLASDIEALPSKKAAHKGPVCFEVPSDYEITFQSKKLVGSAQVRRMGAVLQHGTIPLMGDVTRICNVLTFDSEAERETARVRVQERATTLEQITGEQIAWDTLTEKLASAFASTFQIELASGTLTESEQARRQILHDEKYNHTDWTARF